MTLENQVVLLDLAKRLKELGFKQESAFVWEKNHQGKFEIITIDEFHLDHLRNNYRTPEDLFCSAYTVAELGEMLWNIFEKIGWKYFYEAYSYVFGFSEGTRFVGELGVVNLMRNPDFAARMLIYLKENNLI